MHEQRLDYRLILNMVEPESKILDLGCGEGKLLQLLKREKQARAQGIELDERAIYKCVEKGVSVFHANIEQGLEGYPEQSFDYVILNQSMQETKNADFVIQEALRVGKKVIVVFPNFAHYRGRFRLFFKGKGPITPELPYYWYDTPNLHFLSITDFSDYCQKKNIAILRRFYLGRHRAVHFLPNLRARNGLFLISRPR
ncbi:MAG: methionine biosynthesis protein MetW [Candidatus Omnitrophica bacterium]|nr:methionine biosynthesis protein MetW [Candidatus Omnitrophota bacterium]